MADSNQDLICPVAAAELTFILNRDKGALLTAEEDLCRGRDEVLCSGEILYSKVAGGSNNCRGGFSCRKGDFIHVAKTLLYDTEPPIAMASLIAV